MQIILDCNNKKSINKLCFLYRTSSLDFDYYCWKRKNIRFCRNTFLGNPLWINHTLPGWKILFVFQFMYRMSLEYYLLYYTTYNITYSGWSSFLKVNRCYSEEPNFKCWRVIPLCNFISNSQPCISGYISPTVILIALVICFIQSRISKHSSRFAE